MSSTSSFEEAIDFRQLFESLPGAFAAVRADAPSYSVVAVTDDYLQRTGFSRAAVIGKSIFEALPSDAEADLRSSLERVSASGQSDTYVMRSGAWNRQWRSISSPMFAEGHIHAIVHRLEEGSGDAASTPQASDATPKPGTGEEQFSLSSLESPIGMVLLTPDGRVIDANEPFLQMIGRGREEIVGSGSKSFTHPDDVAPKTHFFAALMLGTQTTDVLEKRYIQKNGKSVWLRSHATVRRNQQQAPTEIIAIVEDITQRKEAEARLRAIYDGTYEYRGLLSPDGTLLEANRPWLEFAGSTREQLVGVPFWEDPWFTWTPEAPEAARAAFKRAAGGEFVRYDAAIRRPGGEWSTFDISLHPIRDEQGRVVLIVPEGRDITALKKLEQSSAFLVKLDDATRALVEPQQIMAVASHLLCGHLKADRCAYVRLDQEQPSESLSGGNGDKAGDPPAARLRISDCGECLDRTLRSRQAFVFEDADSDERLSDVVHQFRQAKIRSGIFVPLHKDDQFIGAMAVYHQEARSWRQEEIELVELVCNRCWESAERASIGQELRHQEQHFRFLAESIPQMLWTATPTGELNYLSRQGLKYLGVDEDTFFERGALDFIHHDDRAAALDGWQHAMQSKSSYENSYRLCRSDGQWCWQLVRGMPMLDEHGTIIQWYGTCTDVQEQKQAEMNLQQQWQTFDTALSHAPDFSYVFDLNGRFRYANEPLLKLLGKSYDGVVGKDFLDLDYPPELALKLSLQIQQVIHTKQPIRDQVPFTGAGGETRQYEHIFVPVIANDGSVRAVTGSSRDIHERMVAEKLVLEDRQRWKNLLLQAPSAIAVLRGPQHCLEWMNAEFVALLGRSSADPFLGKSIRDAFPELASQGYIKVLDRVLETGESFVAHEAEAWTGEPNRQRQIYINFVCTPTVDVLGKVDGLFIHASNVTDLVRARKQLEDREQQFRTLAETIPHLAWMANDDGHIFWYNRRWFEFTGTTLEQMQGWGWTTVHDPDVLPQVMEKWAHSIASGEPFDVTFPLRRADGTFRTFLTRVEPVRDQEGRVVQWFGTNTDITDQKRTEEELRRINRNLEEFSYVASHDLQEPLRMVNIYAQLLARSVDDQNPKIGQYAHFIQQGVTRMEVLMRDLLTFSRAVSADELPVGVADLSTAFHEAVAVLKTRIDESGATIHAPASLPLVRGDTAQMAHVFQNLLSNALKYSKKESLPRIDISVTEGVNEAIVFVRDNGIGFEQKHAENIFGLFKRLHKDSYPGTGLGLAICKRIVERYGGRMWAEGVLNEGATLAFALPHAGGHRN